MNVTSDEDDAKQSNASSDPRYQNILICLHNSLKHMFIDCGEWVWYVSDEYIFS